jgi:uncharacterized membrane protein (DUF485 family)
MEETVKQKASFRTLLEQSHARVLTSLFLFMVLLFVALFASSALAAPANSPAVSSPIVVTAVTAIPATPITPVPFRIPDLGDAPDSTNHFGVSMTAYAGVTAQFPTVFDPTTGLPQGPKHHNQPLRYHLGPGISIEEEADTGPDADGVNNIIPPANNPNNDGFDDGLTLPQNFPHCQLKIVTYNVTVVAGGTTTAYFNLNVDWNRDGQWGGASICPGGALASEWAVQNQMMTFSGPGTYTFTSPAFLTHNANPQKGMWLRARLTGGSIPAAQGDGSGPTNGYRFGETEDYKLPGISVTIEPTGVATIEPHD